MDNDKWSNGIKWRMGVSKQLGWITGLVTFHSVLIGSLIWTMIRLLSMVASLK